jgi:hypothetical protein
MKTVVMTVWAIALTLVTSSGVAAGQEVVGPLLLDGAAMDSVVNSAMKAVRLAQRDRRAARSANGQRHHRGNRSARGQQSRRVHPQGRRDYGRGHRGHGRRNHWVAPALVGVLVGAAIASQSTGRRHHSGYQAAKRRCDRNYRSYDWDSDTFVTYSGKVKLCPYVRAYH